MELSTFRPARTVLRTALLCSALFTAACSGSVVDDLDSMPSADQGGNGNGGSDGTGGSASQTTGTGTKTPPGGSTQPGAAEAIVVTPAQRGLCGGSNGSGTSSSGSSGGSDCDGWPAGTLFLELGSPAPTCTAPALADTTCGTYGVSISIPPGQLAAGNVSTLGLDSFFSFMSPGAPNECGGGGGTFEGGTLTIVDVSSSSVTFSLAGTSTPGFSTSVDGTYVAEVCP